MRPRLAFLSVAFAIPSCAQAPKLWYAVEPDARPLVEGLSTIPPEKIRVVRWGDPTPRLEIPKIAEISVRWRSEGQSREARETFFRIASEVHADIVVEYQETSPDAPPPRVPASELQKSPFTFSTNDIYDASRGWAYAALASWAVLALAASHPPEIYPIDAGWEIRGYAARLNRE